MVIPSQRTTRMRWNVFGRLKAGPKGEAHGCVSQSRIAGKPARSVRISPANSPDCVSRRIHAPPPVGPPSAVSIRSRRMGARRSFGTTKLRSSRLAWPVCRQQLGGVNRSVFPYGPIGTSGLRHGRWPVAPPGLGCGWRLVSGRRGRHVERPIPREGRLPLAFRYNPRPCASSCLMPTRLPKDELRP